MTRKALGGRINDYIGPEIKRIQQVGGCHRVVDNQRNSVLVGDICDRFNIKNGGVRVGDGFNVNDLGIFLDKSLEIGGIVRIFYNVILDARLSEDLFETIERSAVRTSCCKDSALACCDVQKRIRNRCHARRKRDGSGCSRVECRKARVKYIRCRIRKSCIQRIGAVKIEQVVAPLYRVERKRCCLVNGYRNGVVVFSRVIACMQLKRIKRKLV